MAMHQSPKSPTASPVHGLTHHMHKRRNRPSCPAALCISRHETRERVCRDARRRQHGGLDDLETRCNGGGVIAFLRACKRRCTCELLLAAVPAEERAAAGRPEVIPFEGIHVSVVVQRSTLCMMGVVPACALRLCVCIWSLSSAASSSRKVPSCFNPVLEPQSTTYTGAHVIIAKYKSIRLNY
ncbi:hypothetical protein P280DRAFT_479040 [Massarina eburnea CBS 473.64]|uniref:Uncharacterized protein n=1 Tax=Massarina eburnea CBS 473.64 TaxID=1395130 RepID=A0A6A6S5R6_9PLEO|nr:hypothetical protein P280DRAFT_479040 [Massarina eburnea CBS 473.64]